ncbi:MAG: hypothetical protein MZV65_27980 [Chromatiales bacterium]|nr:hypothetical protein [Chromatiales bacterium]
MTHGIDPRTGLIELSLPEGEHDVILEWRSMPIERYSRYLSFVTLLILSILLAHRHWRSRSNVRLPPSGQV